MVVACRARSQKGTERPLYTDPTMTTKTAAPILHVDDEEVQAKLGEASRAACAVLNELFPGHDNGGIQSNFAGLLAETMGKMLRGESLPGHSTDLPALVMGDEHFGNPKSVGTMFVVARRNPLPEGVSDHDTPRPFEVLDDDAVRFVSLDRSESVNPFLSFSAAVQGAVRWLQAEGISQSRAELRVLPVEFSGDGYAVPAGALPPGFRSEG
jgi:hypothetical protein